MHRFVDLPAFPLCTPRRQARSILALSCLAWAICSPTRAAAEEAQKEPERPFIILTIDYGDGFQRRYDRLEHRPEITVRDVMDLMRQHAHGVPFEARGSGETTFVTSIDGIANQGTDGKNWLFRVNDQLARQSCGITRLQPGDSVVWRFQSLD